ncbi:MAG: hypothetical protein ACKVH7_09940 [Alphaproteobacteria bacterium]|jgi:hypothetical protein
MFFAFLINCECSAADRSTAAEFFQSYAVNLCDAEFAEEVGVYYDYALERGWMLDGRCIDVCETDTGIMMSSVLNVISGVEGASTKIPSSLTWDVESGDLGELGQDVREEIERDLAADRQEGIADADPYAAPERSADEIDNLRPGNGQHANTFCRAQPSAPKCRRTDAD